MNKSVTIRAAWIGAIALVFSAIIAGTLSLLNTSGKNTVIKGNENIISSDKVAGDKYVIEGDYVKGDKRNEKEKETHEIAPIINAPKGAVSFNQQGGITAGTVTINIGQPKRTINSSLSLGELKNYAGTQVFLHWRADDNESVLFKDNIGSQLNTAGWIVTQSAAHIADESISNVIIEINRDSPHGDNSLTAALLLEDVLKNSKIAVSMRRRDNNPLPINSMYLRIGPMR